MPQYCNVVSLHLCLPSHAYFIWKCPMTEHDYFRSFGLKAEARHPDRTKWATVFGRTSSGGGYSKRGPCFVQHPPWKERNPLVISIKLPLCLWPFFPTPQRRRVEGAVAISILHSHRIYSVRLRLHQTDIDNASLINNDDDDDDDE